MNRLLSLLAMSLSPSVGAERKKCMSACLKG